MGKVTELLKEKKEAIKETVTIAKESFITAREMAILLILTLFLTSVDFETFLTRKLNHAGISEIMGVKLQTQQQIAVDTAKDSSQRVSELENQVNELVAIINKIKPKDKIISEDSSPPSTELGLASGTLPKQDFSQSYSSSNRSQMIFMPPAGASSSSISPSITNTEPPKQDLHSKTMKTIDDKVKEVQKSMDTAKSAVARNLATQQITLSVIDPKSQIPLEGWVFLGKLTNDKTNWADNKPYAIEFLPYKELKPGAKIRVFKPVHLRSEPSPIESSILSALSIDEELKVEEIKIGTSIDNKSPTCWAKVQRLNINSIIENKK